jgi:hypothetical protein
MAQILPALNFGEISDLESAENAEFFHVIKNMYTQLAQNLIADQPPPFLYRTPVKNVPPLLTIFIDFFFFLIFQATNIEFQTVHSELKTPEGGGGLNNNLIRSKY